MFAVLVHPRITRHRACEGCSCAHFTNFRRGLRVLEIRPVIDAAPYAFHVSFAAQGLHHADIADDLPVIGSG